jgi:hypothetical protein
MADVINVLYVVVNENNEIVKWPYFQSEFKRDHPEQTWPDVIDDQVLLTYGVHRVRLVPFPSHLETRTRSVVQSPPELYEGVWTQVFTINKLAPQYAEENQRGRRNRMLKETDWTQVPDVPLTAEQRQQWSDYRQQLRDLSNLPGWPYDIDWPQSPEVSAVPIISVGS